MISRRNVMGVLFALSCVPFASHHAAAGGEKFTWAAFEAAQKAGKPIVVEISADWCPVCRVQQPIVEDLVFSDKFKSMVHFAVDYDKQKDVLRKFNAQKQSTLIVFKGAKEMGRSVGDTKRPSIEALLAKGM
jgi:thiol-disulfide isomerase/thioredoxin